MVGARSACARLVTFVNKEMTFSSRSSLPSAATLARHVLRARSWDWSSHAGGLVSNRVGWWSVCVCVCSHQCDKQALESVDSIHAILANEWVLAARLSLQLSHQQRQCCQQGGGGGWQRHTLYLGSRGDDRVQYIQAVVDECKVEPGNTCARQSAAR